MASEPILPIPESVTLDPSKVALGKLLFDDVNLSGDGTISCASCHHLMGGGVDNLTKSIGSNHVVTRVNTPTVFNASLNVRQFWDGRSETLRSQIEMAMHDRTIMNTNWTKLAAYLRNNEPLGEMLLHLYPQVPTETAIFDSISIYEASLLTPNSRFDRYLRGDKNAISADERVGYDLFKSYGCASCHQGTNVGGNMFEVLGVVGPGGAYFKERGHMTQADLGRYNVTHRDEDKYMFKVTGLRNVALTAPYLHDGSATTLEQAVNIMFKYQLGRPAESADVVLIIKFLRTLTGQYQGISLDDTSSAATR